MAELDIGKQCDFQECRQLDFLPYQCEGCNHVFCGLHRTKESHLCSMLGVTQENRATYNGPRSYACIMESCHKAELSPITCDGCGEQFCLTHRLAEDHGCPSVVRPPEGPNRTAEHVEQILAKKYEQPRVKKRPLNAKAAKTAAKIALMKLKGNSVGEKTIPEDKRVYFLMYYKDVGVKNKGVYVSLDWSVGKVIDSAAKIVGLTNENNCVSQKKLRVFSSDGHVLAVSGTVSEMISQEVLCSGCSLILEYVDPLTDSVDSQAFIT